MYVAMFEGKTKSVVKNEMIPHHPKKKVMSVVRQNVSPMQSLQRLPRTVRENRMMTTPTFCVNETCFVGADR